jgi:hypothetical protein
VDLNPGKPIRKSGRRAASAARSSSTSASPRGGDRDSVLIDAGTRHAEIANTRISWVAARTRRRGDYLLVLQRPPLRAKATGRDHGIPSRWPEKVDRKTHPHAKPAGLIARLIGAVTAPGDVVVHPAAGSFVVIHVCNDMRRRFVGCDIACRPRVSRRDSW